jgi:hypothetical protein
MTGSILALDLGTSTGYAKRPSDRSDSRTTPGALEADTRLASLAQASAETPESDEDHKFLNATYGCDHSMKSAESST